jgi:hypothetical protein
MKAFALELQNEQVTIAGSSLPAPKITYDVTVKRWLLDEPYAYQDDGYTITVPQGFEFDLASVPRVFWWLIAPFELSISAPLIHDFLYQHRGQPPAGTVNPSRTYTRHQADLVFRDLMEQEGVPVWRRVAAYRSVQLFGWIVWH